MLEASHNVLYILGFKGQDPNFTEWKGGGNQTRNSQGRDEVVVRWSRGRFRVLICKEATVYTADTMGSPVTAAELWGLSVWVVGAFFTARTEPGTSHFLCH